MRVWVTRDEAPGGALSAALEAEGLLPILEPLLVRVPCADTRGLLEGLTDRDWLVLTSAYAVRCLPADLPAKKPRIAAVGPATARAARSRGWTVHLVGEGGAEALFLQLRRRGTRGRILHPCSSGTVPPEAWPGVAIDSPVVYETLPAAYDRSVIDRVDVVALTSPSAAAALPKGLALPLASIGRTTSAAITARGLRVWVEAPRPTFTALARAIATTGRIQRRRT